ncbi:hypothetical protein EV562_103475 [Streptomyces sp. BK208]|uniref:hypothetical protein n=1 Tax=Streptomyces sp. BK208 TaxID=2512150 RepID=UPI0010EBB0D7|nr:hypothetical protein [Streptomyces sp. BK208]TDT40103.1 hypothetical protein EV562_103475 [Streptomyces sp. BK208]
MTTARRTTTIFLTVLSGLLLSIVGLTQRWPAWAWPLLAVLLLVVPAAVFRIAAMRRGTVPVAFEEQLTAAPVERTEHRVSQVVLPSKWPDYDFVFSATVRWYLVDAPASAPVLNPAGLAVDAVLKRARSITEQREPVRASLVEQELSGALSRMAPESTGHLQAMAEGVQLVLAQQDQERLDKLADVRKDEEVWAHQRKYEQSKRRYLGEDVLKDTGSAVVWWLARNDEHVERTVNDLALLAQLTSAANDTDIPERLQNLIPQQAGEPTTSDFSQAEPPSAPQGRETATMHLSDFLDSIGFSDGDVRRPMLAAQIAGLIKEQDRHETAEEIQHHFDPPASLAPDDDETPASGSSLA